MSCTPSPLYSGGRAGVGGAFRDEARFAVAIFPLLLGEPLPPAPSPEYRGEGVGRQRVWRCSALLFGVALLVAGCGTRGPGRAKSTVVEPSPATQPVAPTTLPSITTLPLDQILPVAELPAPRSSTTAPTTAPSSDRPPLEALLLYGRAVDHLNANRRGLAIEMLEKAVAIDPASFELHYALGRAYARDGASPGGRALAALQKAAEINPDHLRLQTELGRAFVTGGEEEKGLYHLRLALKTSAYDTDEAGAAIAELLLGRSLAREGYHAAAVEVYERLMARLQNPGGALRANPETAFLIVRPELLRLQAAESYAQIGRFGPALDVYRAAAQRDPGSLELRARVVKALVGLKRFDDAAAEAADAVARFRASPQALALLREVAAVVPGGGGLMELLERMRGQRPRERSLLFALADIMQGEGKSTDARRVLREAAQQTPADPQVVRRLYEIERDAEGGGAAAAQFLIEWSARYPDAVFLLGDHWDDLLRRSGSRRLGLKELRALSPPADAHPQWAAAKQFWVAHVARLRHRRDVAREALRKAADSRPVFAPALRAWAGWDREELGISAQERTQSVEGFAVAIDSADGDPALAEELRGMLLLSARDFAGAREKLARAVGLSASSPERGFALAVAARGAGDDAAYEQALWKLASDSPGFEDAYEALYSLYEGRDNDSASAQVLSAWLTADPATVQGRLVQVREQIRAGRLPAAQGIIQRLFVERPGDPRVLSALRAMFGQEGSRSQAWLQSELQQRHTSSPGEMAVAAQLVDLLAEEGKAAEATRVLDATRAAVSDDPDLLYQVAHLYTRVGQKATTEQVLREALALEPGHAPAANDLGYSLAEEGRDLEQAESLARLAVGAEPGNPSFLDSLGWVLYKRGQLDEARRHLEQSAGSSGEEEGPDPVVLDHLGDTIYRQGDQAAAGAQWERAMRRLAEMPADQRGRDDLKQLRLQLERKRKQLEAGQPVSAAPVAESVRRAGTSRD